MLLLLLLLELVAAVGQDVLVGVRVMVDAPISQAVSVRGQRRQGSEWLERGAGGGNVQEVGGVRHSTPAIEQSARGGGVQGGDVQRLRLRLRRSQVDVARGGCQGSCSRCR